MICFAPSEPQERNDMLSRKYGKLKAILYTSGNIGVIIWAGLFAVQAPTVLRAALIFVSPLIFMNLLIWYLFKVREKADANEIK
jgi:hypothetical protein